MPKLSITIPYYHNKENPPETWLRLIDNQSLFPAEIYFEYVLGNDGSKILKMAELLKNKEG